jgi:hypothetical protein
MKYHCVVASLLFSAFAFVSPAQEVHTNCDKHTDFTHYHTYVWKKLQTPNPVWQSTVQASVDKALSEKGWRKVATGADVVLSAEGASQLRQDSVLFDDNAADTHPPSMEPAALTVSTYKVGVFVVNVFDAQTKQQVWSGIGTTTVTGNLDGDSASIDKAVSKMLRKFPPSPTKSK